MDILKTSDPLKAHQSLAAEGWALDVTWLYHRGDQHIFLMREGDQLVTKRAGQCDCCKRFFLVRDLRPFANHCVNNPNTPMAGQWCQACRDSIQAGHEFSLAYDGWKAEPAFSGEE